MKTKRIKHVVEYYSLVWFTACVRLLPLSWARFIARRLADTAFYAIPVRKKVVVGNLALSFPEKTSGEIHSIAHSVYRQFAQTMVELLFFPKLSKEDMQRMVTMENLSVLNEALQGGKGAVLVGAHFGNWELMGAALAQVHPVTFVVGQQQNIKVDDLLNSYRLGKGIKIIPLKLALRGVMRTLKNNEFIAILADQDAHEHGAFVPFFGRPASTPKGPAMFALRAGCPVIMGHIFREQGKFRVVFEKVPQPPLTGDEETDIRNYTAAHVSLLEKHTREHPDHWFWLHRRWKTKPPATQS